MPNVLLLTRKKENANILSTYLSARQLRTVQVIEKVEEADAYLAQHNVDLILLDLPFTMDSQELSYAISLLEKTSAFLILLVHKDRASIVREKTTEFGIFTIQKPIIKDVLLQVLSFAKASWHRSAYQQAKQQELLHKIQEIKCVDRAKCLLIEHAYMSEDQAHKYIEKQAMDQRLKRIEIAQSIINTYQAD